MAKYRHYTLYFSPDIDADVIEILDKSGNKSALIRKAIRKHLDVEQTPNTNPDISHWIRIRKNKTHFEYKCFKCGNTQDGRRTPFCPMCGRVMELDVTYNDKGEII